jgi:hypothetical protein
MIDVKKLLERVAKENQHIKGLKRDKCVAVERRKFIELSLAYNVAKKMQL